MERTTHYTVGEPVLVHAFGSWYAGTVTKLGPTKVHAEYTTGTGAVRTKACPPELIKHPDGTPIGTRGSALAGGCTCHSDPSSWLYAR
jgi:hypothetical protein